MYKYQIQHYSLNELPYIFCLYISKVTQTARKVRVLIFMGGNYVIPTATEFKIFGKSLQVQEKETGIWTNHPRLTVQEFLCCSSRVIYFKKLSKFYRRKSMYKFVPYVFE
jgi:hypothetical protein